MKRLTWIELGSLGLLFLFALYIGANYGAFAALLALAVAFMTLRTFIADHQVDVLIDDLRDQRDEAVAQRRREQMRGPMRTWS